MPEMTFEALARKYTALPGKFSETLRKALEAGADLVVRETQMRHLRGPTSVGSYVDSTTNFNLGESLSRRTGRLFHSITKRVEVKGNDIVEASVGTNVVYARIHEYGGAIHRKASTYTRFRLGLSRLSWLGRSVSVGAFGIRMPARPFLRPSVKVQQPRVVELIRERLLRVIKA